MKKGVKRTQKGQRLRIAAENFEWAIGARGRSQSLLLSLYNFGNRKRASWPPQDREVFSLLVGIAYSLWRAAFLANMTTRSWKAALPDGQELISTILRNNTITFSTEYSLQNWMGGYYLNNARFRLLDALRRRNALGQASRSDIARVEGIEVVDKDPQRTWDRLCEEAEAIAQQLDRRGGR